MADPLQELCTRIEQNLHLKELANRLQSKQNDLQEATSGVRGAADRVKEQQAEKRAAEQEARRLADEAEALQTEFVDAASRLLRGGLSGATVDSTEAGGSKQTGVQTTKSVADADGGIDDDTESEDAYMSDAYEPAGHIDMELDESSHTSRRARRATVAVPNHCAPGFNLEDDEPNDHTFNGEYQSDQRSGKWHGSDFPSARIVQRADGSYAQLWCPACKNRCNTGTEGSFFAGPKGIGLHISLKHKEFRIQDLSNERDKWIAMFPRHQEPVSDDGYEKYKTGAKRLRRRTYVDDCDAEAEIGLGIKSKYLSDNDGDDEEELLVSLKPEPMEDGTVSGDDAAEEQAAPMLESETHTVSAAIAEGGVNAAITRSGDTRAFAKMRKSTVVAPKANASSTFGGTTATQTAQSVASGDCTQQSICW